MTAGDKPRAASVTCSYHGSGMPWIVPDNSTGARVIDVGENDVAVIDRIVGHDADEVTAIE